MDGREGFAFDYTVLRVVPRVERQEFVNVGVVLFCKAKRFLDAKIDLEMSRLPYLSPQTDLLPIRARLAIIPAICAGTLSIDAIHDWPQSERFKWLAAPSSTVIQAAPAHRGLCFDPTERLETLFGLFVA
ncbi:MAG: DUF3037 domain-containing protein [Chloroflexota bacterium]